MCPASRRLRVPLIVWSGNAKLVDGGKVNHTPIASIDFYRTFAALAGAEEPHGLELDGEDLTGILADNTSRLDRDALYWHYPGNNRHGTLKPQSVVRSGRWKLIYHYEDCRFELYDLKTDLAESKDLADSRPAQAAELGLMLLRWLDRFDAPLATLRRGQQTIHCEGAYYANGSVSSVDGAFTISAGEECPYVVGNLLKRAGMDTRADVSRKSTPSSDKQADRTQVR